MVQVPVGTGAGGGTLVRDTDTGRVTEIPLSIEPTIIRRGGGGGPRPQPGAPETFSPISGPSALEIRQQAEAQGQADAETLRLRLQRGQITPIEARQGITNIARDTGLSFTNLQVQRILGSGLNVSQLRSQTRALPGIAREISKEESERLGRTVTFTPQDILERISDERLFGAVTVPGVSPVTIPIEGQQIFDLAEGVPELTPRGQAFRETRFAEEELPPLDLGKRFAEKLPKAVQPFAAPLTEALDILEAKAPTDVSLKGPVRSPFGTVFDKLTTSTALGQGTSIIDVKIRPPILAEQVSGVSQKDLSNLQRQVDLIQFDFASGNINQAQAQAKLDKQLDSFTSRQITKKVPESIALGAGLSFLGSTVPFFNVIAGGVIGTEAFLNRRKIAKQFKDFPVETGLVTAGFLAGGLVGSAAGGFAGSFKAPRIDATNLESVSRIRGLSKDRFVKVVEQQNPNFVRLRSSGKITDTIVYDIKLKDGRTFRILEFGKTKIDPFDKKSLVSERGFLGAERGKFEAEQVFGASTGRIGRETGVGERFTRVVSFKPIKAKTGEVVSFEGAKGTDLATKFSVFQIDKTKSGIISNSVILKMKNLKSSIVQRIKSIERKFQNGQKITINELRNLVNLQRTSRGESPFTDAEFRAGEFGTVTGTIVQRLLREANLVVQQNERIVGGSLNVKTVLEGKAFTFPKPELKKGKVPSTPLEFDVSSSRVRTEFNKQLKDLSFKFRDARGRFQDLIKRGAPASQVQRVKNEFGRIKQQVVNLDRSFPASAGEISLALSAEIKNNPITNLDVPTIRFISGLAPSLRSLVGNETLLQTRLEQAQTIKLNLKSKLDLKTKLEAKSTSLSAQGSVTILKQQNELATKLVQRLKSIQRLNQKLRLKNLTIQDVSTRNIPTSPKKIAVPIPLALPSLGKPSKGKPFATPEAKNQGYHAFAKRSGIKQRLNKVPLTKRQARDLFSFTIDHTVARTGGIVRAFNKKALKPQTRIPKGYFRRTVKKYRPFRIVQGRKIPLTNEFIEKTKFAIDTRGEKSGLSIARILARRRKPVKLITSSPAKKNKPFKPDASTLSKNLKKRRKN